MKDESFKGIRVGVLGATGAVGRELVSLLDERGFPASVLRCYGSEKSIGETVEFLGEEVSVEQYVTGVLEDLDLLFLAAGAQVNSRATNELSGKLSGNGVITVDCNGGVGDGGFLVVPEVNGDEVRGELTKGRLCFASPSSVVIPLAVALAPLAERFGLKRVVVSTYQSTATQGRAGMDELWKQTLALLSGEEIIVGKYPSQIAFNCIPQVGLPGCDGATTEEEKIEGEVRELLNLKDLPISVTCVQVPTFACSGISVNIEVDAPVCLEEVTKLLRESPGILLVEGEGDEVCPSCIDLANTDATCVGRIRVDRSIKNGLNIWVVADVLRKGSALNAVQIAELLVARPERVH